MGMRVSAFLPITWFSLLLFGCSYRGLEATVTDVCENDYFDQVVVVNSSKNISFIHIDPTNFTCLLYPTHDVNCSWSFQSFGMEAKITTNISICDGDKTVLTQEFKASVGSHSSHIEKTFTHLILHFNIILHDQWAVYYYNYENESLEVPSPPSNVQGLFQGNDLLVRWENPYCLIYCSVDSLEFELRINNQENPKQVLGHLFYNESNVDLTQSYTVKVRTRIQNDYLGSHHWSGWSHSVTIQAKESVLNVEVIIAISLGIPMVLLALLLVICQRLSARLFPPIPSPPHRYLHVLQNNDHHVTPDLTVNRDEELTIVFYPENEKEHKSINNI